MTGSNAKYFGYGHIAGVCDAAITNLFSPSIPSPPPSPPPHHQHGYPSPPPSATSSPHIGHSAKTAQWQAREGIDTPPHSPVASEGAKDVPELKEFIAYALYRTRLPDDIVFSSLLLLARLKKLYPSARGTASSPHRLFLSALMLASKMSMDDTYSNRSWCIVGQQLFTLPEVNRMERELFGFLNWNCCVSRAELEEWKTEWIAPEGIIGHIAAALNVAPTASATTGGSRRSGEGKAKPPRSKGEETDRDRQSRAAAAALLRPSASTSTPPSVPASPSSPRPASSSSRRHFRQNACAGYSVASGPHNPLHMRQSSDSSMRSASSSGSSGASSASLCASSLGSPRSGASDSPASSGPWTPESGSEDALEWGAAAPTGDVAEEVKPWSKTGGYESNIGGRRAQPVWS